MGRLGTQWCVTAALVSVVMMVACDSAVQEQPGQPYLAPPSSEPLPDIQQLGSVGKDVGQSMPSPEDDVDFSAPDATMNDSGSTWPGDVGAEADWGVEDPTDTVTTTDTGHWMPLDVADESDVVIVDVVEPVDTTFVDPEIHTGDPEDAGSTTDFVQGTPDLVIDPPDQGGSGQPDVVEPPSYDCSAVPPGPFQLKKLSGPMASEDLAFDAAGNVVGSNDKAIFKSPYGGAPQVFVPSISFRAGLRYLPDGNLVVCNDKKGELTRIDPNGVQYKILGGLAYPNGLTVDMKGLVYFTEHDGNKVWRVHPYTSEKLLLTNQIKNPNGVIFSPDYKTLYIDGFSGVGTIYKIQFDDNGNPGPLTNFATKVGTGWLDGLGVDVCGNVYVCDYGQTVVYRISPDGQSKVKVIDGSKISGTYLPNMQWGSGLGGWDPLKLYLPDGWKKGVFEVDLQVPAPPRPYP
ncbi:MAG: SMP-30/gluconolactonase/LRE family protein [Myxococcales bacterium]|nr:SMP-30/gluconolactonase/LRE family protein [Myxococcales bacterium]